MSAALTSLEIVGKGINLTEAMLNEMRANVTNSIKQIDLRTVRDENELSGIIRRSIKNYIFKATKKNPMILPVVMVV
jgi:ribonuclease J